MPREELEKYVRRATEASLGQTQASKDPVPYPLLVQQLAKDRETFAEKLRELEAKYGKSDTKLENERKEWRTKVRELQGQTQELQDALQESRVLLEEHPAQKALDQANAELRSLKEQIQELHNESIDSNRKIGQLQDALAAARAETVVAQRNLSKLKTEAQKRWETERKLAATVEELQTLRKESKERLEQAMRNNDALSRRNSELEASLSSANAKIATLSNQLDMR
eukprot:m51a1_g14613 hypothetical protein (226) ;mRNA; r:1211457-1212362